jgi:hypothetical protein
MLPPPACFFCEINPNWVCEFARPRKSITAVGAFAMRGEGRGEREPPTTGARVLHLLGRCLFPTMRMIG